MKRRRRSEKHGRGLSSKGFFRGRSGCPLLLRRLVVVGWLLYHRLPPPPRRRLLSHNLRQTKAGRINMSDSKPLARRSAPFFALLLATLLFTHVAFAQSPNTASMIVVATDQNGAVVKDAKVTVSNDATGDSREAVTDGDGSATIPALS